MKNFKKNTGPLSAPEPGLISGILGHNKVNLAATGTQLFSFAAWWLQLRSAK